MVKLVKLEGIDRETLSQQVYSLLRQRILQGEIKQNERLSELGISQQLGVSATPVREALRLLNGDGLVEYEGRKGVRVIQPTREEIRQCYAVRIALETLALREAAPNFSAAEKKQFLELARAADVGTGKTQAFIKADRNFHEFFLERSGNVWLRSFHSELIDFLLVVRQKSQRDARIRATVKDHVEIANAINEGDVDEAVAALTRHIERAREWALSSYAELTNGNGAAIEPKKRAASTRQTNGGK